MATPFPKIKRYAYTPNAIIHSSTAVEVQVPTANEQQNQVAANERSEDAEVSPARIEGNSERLVELISDAVRTV